MKKVNEIKGHKESKEVNEQVSKRNTQKNLSKCAKRNRKEGNIR